MEKNHIQIFVKGLDDRTLTFMIHKDAMVDDLKRKIHLKNGIAVEHQRIFYVSKFLELGKRLSDYHIDNESTLYLVLRLLGGAKELDEDVELSEAPDMITWDDDAENKRAKMPCGHAITPESLTSYCRSLLDTGKSRFLCPYLSPDEPPVYCGKEWDYITVRRLAVLTSDEKKEFESKISENFLMKSAGIQECPRCMSMAERPEKKVRVVCPLCTLRRGTNFEFCWNCLREWKTTGTKKCGNEDCSGEDPRLKILRECKKKTVIGVENCPAIRACVKCGMLIEHIKNCKQMICRCKAEFCFICLSTKTKKGWSCGSYNQACKIAPIQTSVVGAE
ncbi:E3 ubiquitin-protein ligase arih1-like [Actinia tenebrosa]|uniref:E3 ubiquitin-protein ligase arih1-like n=1 Tax=Actinia tenebrosa TaxID=6105 RepID=A0A6P8HRH0_ACTTE|nr:E3 ubiquitin-protein ligase arih1-like [Actinia tenebrosa]